MDSDERLVPAVEQEELSSVRQLLLLLQPPESVDVHDAHVHDGCDVTGGVEALWVLRECTGVPCWTAGL